MIEKARLGWRSWIITCCAGVIFLSAAGAQEPKKAPPKPGPMLSDGFETLDTPEFQLALVRSSQTVAALHPKLDSNFDFTPGDRLTERSQDGYYHLGDLDIRLRSGEGEWKDYSTALRRAPVKQVPHDRTVLATADLSGAFSDSIPLHVVRSWSIVNGKLTLRFTISNVTNGAIEIGGLGVPMVFNNDMNERTLEQAHAICSFYDPYIGQEAGYLQVTRLNGHDAADARADRQKNPLMQEGRTLEEQSRAEKCEDGDCKGSDHPVVGELEVEHRDDAGGSEITQQIIEVQAAVVGSRRVGFQLCVHKEEDQRERQHRVHPRSPEFAGSSRCKVGKEDPAE